MCLDVRPIGGSLTSEKALKRDRALAAADILPRPPYCRLQRASHRGRYGSRNCRRHYDSPAHRVRAVAADRLLGLSLEGLSSAREFVKSLSSRPAVHLLVRVGVGSSVNAISTIATLSAPCTSLPKKSPPKRGASLDAPGSAAITGSYPDDTSAESCRRRSSQPYR